VLTGEAPALLPLLLRLYSAATRCGCLSLCNRDAHARCMGLNVSVIEEGNSLARNGAHHRKTAQCNLRV
jgi:hypothetical protein